MLLREVKEIMRDCTCNWYAKYEKRTQFRSGNLFENGHMQDLERDAKVILRCILHKYEVGYEDGNWTKLILDRAQ
jgi:hypothetical protein